MYPKTPAFLSLKIHSNTNSEKRIPKNLQIAQLVNLIALVIPFSPLINSTKFKNK
jgi:hypothetical protein